MGTRPGRWIPTLSVSLGLAIVVLAGTRAYLHTASHDQAARWVSDAHQVIETLDELLIAMDDAAALRRGFVLNGNAAQLGAFRAAVDRFATIRSRLWQLTRDNPEQQKRLGELDLLLTTRLAQLEGSLRAPGDPGFDAAHEPAITTEANAQSDRIRELADDMVADEKRLLAAHQAAESADSVAVKRTLLAGFGISSVVLILAFLLLRREAARRTRTEEMLADREQRTAITLNSIADGVVATDTAGKVIQMNPVAEHLTGWPMAEVVGKPFAEVFRIVHEKTRAPEPDPVARVLASGANVGLANHTLLVARDGTERPIADSAAPILDHEGQLQGVVIVFRDVTASRASEARFRRLVEAAPDAILITDRTGHITIANEQVNALFGYTQDELSGQLIEVLIPDQLRTQHAQHRIAYGAAPTVRAMGAGLLLFARRKDGSVFPVEISLSPLQTSEDLQVIAAVRDVSKRHALELFRDEYLEFISHDLKNPLSVITLQARVLARQLSGRELSEEARGVAVIAQSAAFIDGLVRELLEMAHVESESFELDLEPTALVPFLEAILERTISSVDRARVRIDVQDAVVALVEERRIERVVVNFLQNALKYAPAGTPIVVRLEAREQMAVVSVADQGPGLSPDEASFVFEKYRRTVGAKRKEGLGLGLYISRRIVEAHGGQIGVETAPGRGARFFFRVPLAMGKPARPAAPAAFTDTSTSRLRGIEVLLVDDEVNAVSALSTLLRDEGIQVSGVTSGEEALAAARNHRPDVAIVDVQMPGMGGLELLERLRSLHPGLPAVIMSGYMVHHAGIVEARGATGAAYVPKPVDVEELLRTLERIV